MTNPKIRVFNHELKLARAKEHLDRLDLEVRRWAKVVPHRITQDTDTYAGKTVLRLEVLEEPPARFGLIAGDCLQNLRTSLDYIVFEIARKNLGDFGVRVVESQLAFPITTSESDFVSKSKRALRGIPPVAQAIIKDLQPYNRPHGGTPCRLKRLNELARMDRHRLPFLTAAITDRNIFDVGKELIPENAGYFTFHRPEGSAQIGHFPTRSGHQPKMDVNIGDAISVAFKDREKSLDFFPATKALTQCHNYIRGVVFRRLRDSLV